MPILQERIQLLVELEVSSYQDFPEERFMQVWGHVGDYEVSICLPYTAVLSAICFL